MGAISEEFYKSFTASAFSCLRSWVSRWQMVQYFPVTSLSKKNAICAVRMTKVMLLCETVLRLLKYFGGLSRFLRKSVKP